MDGDCSIRVEGIGFSADEIAACAKRLGLLSIELELSASTVCSCETCRSRPGTSQPPLSLEEIGNLVDQAKGLGCKRVILVERAGEPYPHLQQLVSELRGSGLEVELLAANAGITLECARFLYDHHVAIALPMDWPDCSSRQNDEQLDELHVVGPAPRTIAPPALEMTRALEIKSTGFDFDPSSMTEMVRSADPTGITHHRSPLQNLKYAGYSTSTGPTLAIRIFVGTENVDAVPSLWRNARKEGFEPHVQISTPRGNADSGLSQLTADRTRQLFEELARIDSEEFDHHWTKPPGFAGRSCNRHLYACHVTACGTIQACVGVTIPLGNIRLEPLREIVGLSEVLENLRAFTQKVKEPCRTCSNTTDCYGCRGSVYQLTGDYLAGDQLCWKAQDALIQVLPVNVVDLVPHGPSMRMVDRLLSVDERRARAEFTVRPDSVCVDSDGRFDTLAYIEMIAQTFAATHGFHLSSEERRMHRGLLLGIKDLVISGSAHVGNRLTIDIHKITRFGDFGIVDGEVRHEDGQLLGACQIKIWRPSEETAKAMIL